MSFLSLFSPSFRFSTSQASALCASNHPTHKTYMCLLLKVSQADLPFWLEGGDSHICENIWDDDFRPLCVFLHQQMLGIDWKEISELLLLLTVELCFRYTLHCQSFLHTTATCGICGCKSAENHLCSWFPRCSSVCCFVMKQTWSLTRNLYLLSSVLFVVSRCYSLQEASCHLVDELFCYLCFL